jgi:hypothetical protein
VKSFQLCLASFALLALLPAVLFAQTASGLGQVKSAKVMAAKTDIPYPLSDSQKHAIQAIHARNKLKAAPTALRLANTVKQVYDNLLAEKMDEQLADKLRLQMKEVVGDLVVIRGEAMREAVTVLNSQQKQFLKTELSKPGGQGELIEVMMKVFKIPEK